MANLTLQQIQTMLSEYDPPSFPQKDIKATMALTIMKEPQWPDEVAVQALREDISAEVLYSDEMLRGPTTLFRILRDYLRHYGLEYSQGPGSNRISNGLVNMFLVFDEDKQFAFGQLSKFHLRANPSGESSHSQPGQSHSSGATHESSGAEGNERKLAQSLSSLFRREDRFSGKVGEDINEFINSYSEACLDFEMNATQKLKFFHRIFEGEAKTFYRNNIAHKVGSFNEAIVVMRNEYSSIARQNRVRKFLQGLSLRSIMREKRLSVSESLDHLREVISKYAPQGPENHRSENDKIEYLSDALVGTDWAKPVLAQSTSASPAWSFQQLFTALDTAWLHEQREKDSKAKSSSSSLVPSSLPGVNFVGQQRTYGIPRRHGSKSSNPRRFEGTDQRLNQKDKYGNIRQCNNCGSKYHLMRDCKHPPKITQNVNRILKTNPRSVKHVLFELCQQTEELINYEDVVSDEEDPFSSLQSEHDSDEGEVASENHLDADPSHISGDDELDPQDF